MPREQRALLASSLGWMVGGMDVTLYAMVIAELMRALGLMQSGFAIGWVLAAVISAIVLPRWGWRAASFAGVAPVLLTLWIRRGVEESPLWLAGPAGERASPESRHNLSVNPYRKLAIVTLLMNSAALFAWWGSFTRIPPYLALPVEQGGRGLAIAASSVWIAVMQVGMWLGYVAFGFPSDALGGKKTYVGYLVLAAVLVPLYARAGAATTVLALGPLVAFFGTGHFTGFGIMTSELFPTSFRASPTTSVAH